MLQLPQTRLHRTVRRALPPRQALLLLPFPRYSLQSQGLQSQGLEGTEAPRPWSDAAECGYAGPQGQLHCLETRINHPRRHQKCTRQR